MLARIRLSVSRLVDGLGGPALSNAALLIEGDRIAEVGVEASVPRPEDCLELTFPDATALPGQTGRAGRGGRGRRGWSLAGDARCARSVRAGAWCPGALSLAALSATPCARRPWALKAN